MVDTGIYDAFIEILGFAIACFSLGYTLGKDHSSKK